MRSRLVVLLVVLSFLTSCSAADYRENKARVVSPGTAPQYVNESAKASAEAGPNEKVSLADMDKAATTAEAFDRKIIRNADITIEVASPTEAQHKVATIAEAHGGFIVTSEAKQREAVDPGQRTIDIKLVVRVPSNQFGSTFDQIKGLASNTPQENMSSQDVTEEFIDLEARIKTQKALEVQFLEIMRQANKIADALEVQRQIAEVRTEIEKLEGRKRFLENRSSLSTINVNIYAPKPMVAVTSTGFGHSLREAVSDSIGLGSDMVLFFARFVIMMLPVFVFVLLPSGLVIRYLLRRAKRFRLAHQLATPNPK
jgi:hypothetical protein